MCAYKYSLWNSFIAARHSLCSLHPTRNDAVLLEHVHERVEHLEAALPHGQIVLPSQLDHVFELDLSLTRLPIAYEVIVPIFHRSDHHAVPQRVLEAQPRRARHAREGG